MICFQNQRRGINWAWQHLCTTKFTTRNTKRASLPHNTVLFLIAEAELAPPTEGWIYLIKSETKGCMLFLYFHTLDLYFALYLPGLLQQIRDFKSSAWEWWSLGRMWILGDALGIPLNLYDKDHRNMGEFLEHHNGGYLGSFFAPAPQVFAGFVAGDWTLPTTGKAVL